MDASVDSRFLDRWKESCRRQSEARRFLARQAIPAIDRDPDAVAEVVEVFERHGRPGRASERGSARRPISTVGDLLD